MPRVIHHHACACSDCRRYNLTPAQRARIAGEILAEQTDIVSEPKTCYSRLSKLFIATVVIVAIIDALLVGIITLATF